MTGIRVASCIDSMAVSGGTELNAVRTVERLGGLGVDATVFTLNGTGSMHERYAAAGVDVLEFPVDSLLGRSALRQVDRMADAIRERGIQIVHAHDSYSNFLATLAARRANVPVIASKRWIQNPLKRHLWTNRIAYRLASRVLANSAAVAQSLQADEWVQAARVFVIPNFVDDDVFEPISAEERLALRQSLDIPADALVIGCVARLRSEKDHPTLLDAFAALSREVDSARLLLVGDGPEEGALRAHAERLGITDRVTFAGHRSASWRLHQVGDVSTLTSLHEGFPNTVVEAMASGRPVVATRVGGIPDAVLPGETGLLVTPRDSSGLLNALRTLALDADLRHRMGVAGRARARTLYRADSVVGALVREYRTITKLDA